MKRKLAKLGVEVLPDRKPNRRPDPHPVIQLEGCFAEPRTSSEFRIEFHFSPRDRKLAQVLRQHEHVQSVRDRIATSSPEVGRAYNDNFSLAGTEGVPKFAKVYAAVPTAGRFGNLAAAYLGSYPLEYKVTSVNKDGRMNVVFKVRNESTLASAVRPPKIGYEGPYREFVGPMLNNLVPSGPLSRTSQTFQWTEQISPRRR